MIATPKLTLDTVLKTFTKAQNQLNKLIEQNTATIDAKNTQIADLSEEVSVVSAERDKARAVLTNINKILAE